MPSHSTAAISDAAFDAVPTPSFIVSDDGRVLAINAAARERFLTWPTTEAIESLTVVSEAVALSDVSARPKRATLRLVRSSAPPGAPKERVFEAVARRAALGRRRTAVAISALEAEVAAPVERSADAADRVVAPRLKTAHAAAKDTRMLFADRLKHADAAERLLLIGAGVGLWEQPDLSNDPQIWSTELCALFGLDGPPPKPGRDALLSLIEPDDRDRVAAAFDEAGEHGGVRIECRVRVDGMPRWFLLTGRADRRPGPGGSARPVGMVGSAVDIDDRVRLETRLAEANAELERFAVLAAHDLQEPLRKIAMQSDLLSRDMAAKAEADRTSFDALQEKAAAIRGHAVRMRRLTQDLLGHAQAGSAALRIEPMSLRAAIDEASELISAAIDESGAAIEVDGDDAFDADPILFGRVLQNLLANAVKYRSEAPPRIRVSGRRVDGGYRIVVADNGVGFEPEEAGRLFGMFARLGATATRSGSGVGLALCDRVVRRLGGRIAADGRPGRGATFTIELPQPPRGD